MIWLDANKANFFIWGLPIAAGHKVTVHWEGFNNGYHVYTTGDDGVVQIFDEHLGCHSRRAEHIYVQYQSKGATRIYALDGAIVRKNQHSVYELEQWRQA